MRRLALLVLVLVILFVCAVVSTCLISYFLVDRISGVVGEEGPAAEQPTLAVTQPPGSGEGDTSEGPLPPSGELPRFKSAGCPFPSAHLQIECGYLLVLEERGDTSSQVIELAVAIVKSLEDNPAPDPIIYLAGGPGGNALADIEEVWLPFPLLKKRDIILIDQRGTGYSKPTLNCPELEDEDLEDETEATSRCRDRLLSMGVNLSSYNSAASAADINDLRLVLGYEQVNLLGISYGTRLALTIMRDHPRGIRSVILDSTYPPQVDAYTEEPLTTLKVLGTLFNGCSDNPRCSSAYPDLETVFYELVERLNQQSAEFTLTDPETGEDYDESLIGDDLVGIMIDSLYDTRAIPYLPAVIYAFDNGEYERAYELLDAPYEFGGEEEEGQDDPDVEDVSDSEGMFYSVECKEEVPFTDLDAAESAVQQYPVAVTESLIWGVEDMIDLCDQWGVEPAAQIENQPVASSIPTLILAGEYDPVTPPPWGRQAAEHLSNGYFFEFPGYGHAMIDAGPCPVQIMNDFIDHPERSPDTACIAGISSPDFVLP